MMHYLLIRGTTKGSDLKNRNKLLIPAPLTQHIVKCSITNI